MNYQEILSELDKQGIDVVDFAYGDMPNPLPNIGSWKEVYQQGGEGRGEDWQSVKHFPEQNVHIKISGFYSSYDGLDFDGGISDCSEEVKPVDRMVTVYE